MDTTDNIKNPEHYARFSIEPIDFIMTNKLEFWQGNIIKYVVRYDSKNGIEDLRKARQYLDMQIKRMEDEESRDSESRHPTKNWDER